MVGRCDGAVRADDGDHAVGGAEVDAVAGARGDVSKWVGGLSKIKSRNFVALDVSLYLE